MIILLGSRMGIGEDKTAKMVTWQIKAKGVRQ